jgi:IS1 family transposase/transposase-like protein
MECIYCESKKLIKKGRRNYKQRYQCKKCKKYQQDLYTYTLYREEDGYVISFLTSEGIGISSLSRFLKYSKPTIVRKIKDLSSKVKRPVLLERNQIYEVDEMKTYIRGCSDKHAVWVTYALNRKTKQVVDFVVGSRTKETLDKVIKKVKLLNPSRIVTDNYVAYIKLIKPINHDTRKAQNNRIERSNLNLRTHLKRLTRKTICYSKSMEMLEACLLLYFQKNNWEMKV